MCVCVFVCLFVCVCVCVCVCAPFSVCLGVRGSRVASTGSGRIFHFKQDAERGVLEEKKRGGERQCGTAAMNHL